MDLDKKESDGGKGRERVGLLAVPLGKGFPGGLDSLVSVIINVWKEIMKMDQGRQESKKEVQMEEMPLGGKRKVKAIAWKEKAIAWKVFGVRKVTMLAKEGPAREEAIAWKVVGVKRKPGPREGAEKGMLAVPGLVRLRTLGREQIIHKPGN